MTLFIVRDEVMDSRGRLAPAVFAVAKAARGFPLSVIVSCSIS